MKVGLIGAGGMGNVHARQYSLIPDIELHFFEFSPDRRAFFAHRWTAVPHESLDSLVSAVDAVDVCIPTDLHAETTLKSVKAGKPTLCEKPLARTLDEARQIVEAAESANVMVMVGQVVRYFPDFVKGRQLVLSGAVGTPSVIRTHRGGATPVGSGSWFSDHRRSGGVLVDVLVHDFDWIRWTFGEVVAVDARSHGSITETGPDYALILLTLERGAIAHVEGTWLDPAGFRSSFEVAGSSGLIQYDSRNVPSLKSITAQKTGYEGNWAPTDDPYFRQVSAFVDAVKSGAPSPVGPREGFAALSIALAAMESAKTGKKIAPARL